MLCQRAWGFGENVRRIYKMNSDERSNSYFR